jgi:Ca2+-binding EF-hand superfamily protein
MDGFRQQFESDLKAKLQQKATGQFSEETVLLRAFKYFDLDNSGAVSFPEFRKAIERIGLIVSDFTKLEQVFKQYDSDRSGELNYKEFTSGLYAQQPEPTRPGTATRRGLSESDQVRAEEVMGLIRQKIAQRGTRGIMGLGRLFKIIDDDNSNSLDLAEFAKAMNDFRLDLPAGDIQLVFKLIDRDQSNHIDYDEFIREIRGPINDFRKALVNRAFDKLDANGNGVVDLEDIRPIYSAKGHPDVKAGRKTEEEILLEFLDTFEMHHGLMHTGEKGDHSITREEFQEYYTNVSASIDDDRYFEVMIVSAWKLNEAPAYTRNKAWAADEGEEFKASRRGGVSSSPPAKLASGASPSKLPRNVEALLERLRTRLAARGARGIIGIGRSFRIMDDDNSRSLSKAEFKKACRDYRLDIDDQEVDTLFTAIDRDRSGELDYDELIRAIRGPMNDFRKGFVQQAWRKLDRDGNGVLEVEDLIGVYSGKLHPDVRAGKKTEEEVLGEFLETFEMQLSITEERSRDRKVTLDEFEEYYCNVSASIDDDRYFEVMMVNAWKLNGESPKKEAWAGSVSQPNYNPEARRGAHYSSRAAPFGTSEDTEFATAYRPATASRSEAPQGARPSTASSEQLVETLREKLKGRGARGLIGLARQFKIMDDDRSGSLDPQEFRKALKDFRVDVSDEDAQRLFTIFDPDRSGQVDYEEFLHRIRGVLNPARKALVQEVFAKLDRTGDGIVALEDIKGVYNASQHPDVRAGKKTEDDILGDFLDTFEQHHALFSQGQARDKRVTLDEFLEYYAHISASIDDDRYFELMMKNAWKLDARTYERGWAGDNTSPPKRTR